jgi:Rieske Fe-S protein
MTPRLRALPRRRFLQCVVGAVALAAGADLMPQLLAPLRALAATAGPGTPLGSVKGLPRNQALTYTDPASGDPALLLHLADGRYAAYDAICTHAGCTVPYDPARRLLICPCHGATYDPARGAAVVAGPAPQPLASLAIRVDAQGNAYALDGKPGTGQAAPRLQKPPPYTGGSGDDDAAGRRGRRGSGGRDDNGGRPRPPGDD